MFGKIGLIKVLAKKVWWIGVQSNCYVMCMWRLNGFSLVKLCSFAEFTKLSATKHSHYTIHQLFKNYMSKHQQNISIYMWYVPLRCKVIDSHECKCLCSNILYRTNTLVKYAVHDTMDMQQFQIDKLKVVISWNSHKHFSKFSQ